MLLTIKLVILVIGLLMYLLINRPEGAKVAEIGRVMFFVALMGLMFEPGLVALLGGK